MCISKISGGRRGSIPWRRVSQTGTGAPVARRRDCLGGGSNEERMKRRKKEMRRRKKEARPVEPLCSEGRQTRWRPPMHQQCHAPCRPIVRSRYEISFLRGLFVKIVFLKGQSKKIHQNRLGL
jgi:hypothetical protein